VVDELDAGAVDLDVGDAPTGHEFLAVDLVVARVYRAQPMWVGWLFSRELILAR